MHNKIFKKTKIQTLPVTKPPDVPCTNLATTTRQPISPSNKVTKIGRPIQRAKAKAPVASGSSNSAARSSPTSHVTQPVSGPYKSQYDTRSVHKQLSDEDANLANNDKTWAITLKRMGSTIISRLEGRRIALFYPWKIEALTIQLVFAACHRIRQLLCQGSIKRPVLGHAHLVLAAMSIWPH